MNKYCVYYHRDRYGNIVYVGSGTLKRPYVNSSRSKEHKEIFDSLSVEVVKTGLSKQESIELETKLYEELKDTGLLINKIKPTRTKEIIYSEISKHFKYDTSSQTFLIRSNDNGVSYTAGGIDKSTGYCRVKLNKIKYYAHRIVWCLEHKMDVPIDMVIDHIDGNKTNNNITNLRLVTQSENMLNVVNKQSSKKTGSIAKRSSRNSSGTIGVCFDRSNNTWLAYGTLPCGKSTQKKFNPRTLFPNIDESVASQLAFELAVKFRKELEENLKLENVTPSS